MSTQPPEPPNENTGDEPIDRIDELEERLAGIEEVLRLNAIEDRVSDLEEDANEDGDADNSTHEGEGQKALRLALAAFLNNENMAKAASELVTTLGSTIKEWSGLKTKELQNQKAITLGTYFGGLGFSAFLLDHPERAVVARQDHQRTRCRPSGLPYRLLVWPRQTKGLVLDLGSRRLRSLLHGQRSRGWAGRGSDLDDHGQRRA